MVLYKRLFSLSVHVNILQPYISNLNFQNPIELAIQKYYITRKTKMEIEVGFIVIRTFYVDIHDIHVIAKYCDSLITNFP